MSAELTIFPGEQLYILVGDGVAVYIEYELAVADLRATLEDGTDAFLVAVSVDQEETEDVALSLEPVDWQRIVRTIVEQDARGTDPDADAEGESEETG